MRIRVTLSASSMSALAAAREARANSLSLGALPAASLWLWLSRPGLDAGCCGGASLCAGRAAGEEAGALQLLATVGAVDMCAGKLRVNSSAGCVRPHWVRVSFTFVLAAVRWRSSPGDAPRAAASSRDARR